MKTIIALDDSPCSEKIVRDIDKRIWNERDLIKLVSILEPPCGDESCELNDEIARKRFTHVEQICAKAQRMLGHFPCNVELEIKEGDAVKEILDTAKSWQADKIIVGSHGHGICPHNLQRSVSHLLKERARCEVEIIT